MHFFRFFKRIPELPKIKQAAQGRRKGTELSRTGIGVAKGITRYIHVPRPFGGRCRFAATFRARFLRALVEPKSSNRP
jgi:hypothetical protein